MSLVGVIHVVVVVQQLVHVLELHLNSLIEVSIQSHDLHSLLDDFFSILLHAINL